MTVLPTLGQTATVVVVTSVLEIGHGFLSRLTAPEPTAAPVDPGAVQLLVLSVFSVQPFRTG